MMKSLEIRPEILLMTLGVLLTGCANLSPFQPHPGIHSSSGKQNIDLQQLPSAREKLVAAVYRFRDQTGKYEPSENVASWSTAVTQGATSILLQALDDSGWFVPIEREGISYLMNERQIIRSIRAEHGENTQLPPLMYAGILLEGGIIGYDSNVQTGGAGARYLGIGGSTEFRQDKVTVYLRAVSTQNSRILKMVHSTETILSQKVDAHVFRFVDENRILEGEAGYTFNEPGTLAVTRAIEKAVEKLIVYGIREGLWSVSEEEVEYLEEFNESFDHRQEAAARVDYFQREIQRYRGRVGLGVKIEGQRYQGNYPGSLTRPALELDLMFQLRPWLMGGVSVYRGTIAAREVFESTWTGSRLALRGLLFPSMTLTPFLEIGGGAMVPDEDLFRYRWEEWVPYAEAAGGVEFMITQGVGLSLSVRSRQTLQQTGLDGVEMGRFPDRIWSVGGGLTFYGW